MMITFCIPCMNRVDDLRKIMPYLIDNANSSPRVEILILDYNSTDNLAQYIKRVQSDGDLAYPNKLTYIKYSGRNYYHMAHARNMACVLAGGEYIISYNADFIAKEGFIKRIREIIEEENPVFIKDGTRGLEFCGVIVCKKEEFMDAGGFDERFEFYGPEDKELVARLTRRGGKSANLPNELLQVIPTPDTEREKNYRVKLKKREMSHLMREFYLENEKNKVLVANEGKPFGQW